MRSAELGRQAIHGGDAILWRAVGHPRGERRPSCVDTSPAGPFPTMRHSGISHVRMSIVMDLHADAVYYLHMYRNLTARVCAGVYACLTGTCGLSLQFLVSTGFRAFNKSGDNNDIMVSFFIVSVVCVCRSAASWTTSAGTTTSARGTRRVVKTPLFGRSRWTSSPHGKGAPPRRFCRFACCFPAARVALNARLTCVASVLRSCADTIFETHFTNPAAGCAMRLVRCDDAACGKWHYDRGTPGPIPAFGNATAAQSAPCPPKVTVYGSPAVSI